MDGLLTPVSTTYKSSNTEAPLLQEVKRTERTERPEELETRPKPRQQFRASSVEEALEILKNEPDYDTLVSVLQYLLSGTASLDIRRPSPQAAQIVRVLVAEIVPNYWTLLREEQAKRQKAADLDLLLGCLKSMTGLSAVLARLRALTREAKANSAATQRSDLTLNLEILIDVLATLLEGDTSLSQLWAASIPEAHDPAKRRPLAQEFLNILGGGRIISVAAEAEEAVEQKSKTGRGDKSTWITNGKDYSRWLALGIVRWARQGPEPEDAKLCTDLLGKALRLGYKDVVVSTLVTELLLDSEIDVGVFKGLFSQLPVLEQKKTLASILKFLAETYLNQADTSGLEAETQKVSAVAGLINKIVRGDSVLEDQLVSWLTTSSGGSLGDGVGIRRAVVAVVSQDRDRLSAVLEKALEQFGDQLFIKHSPMLQQEAQAQVLLLAAGYVHRLAPFKLAMAMRSSSYLNAISNRLAASQNRARFLGMVVGEAVSGLVEGGDKRLDFHMEELESDEANWYKGLVNVVDKVGSLEILRSRLKPQESRLMEAKPAAVKPLSKPVAKRPTVPLKPPTTGFVIEEIDDDDEPGKGREEEEDDDIVPYAKPDSDAEDSDEDPTMVRRDKPKAPVYVRDLIVYLRDTDNYDRQRLALTTAPVLIRRKANFGTEVKEHAEELASLLVGLQDKYDMEDFYSLKQQGLVALIVAQPKTMGPWFARTFFEGDYSIAQRATVLTAIGLSARELAGFEASEYASAAAFPSKTLPERVERLYLDDHKQANQLPSSSSLKALPPSALDTIAQSLTSNFLAPIAADAADAVTGPDALKLSSFTSRLQARTQQQQQAGAKGGKSARGLRAIPNTTAQLISTAFFFPLTARFQAAAHSSSARTRGVVFHPHLLALYLRTLALLLHAAGPSTLALPDMTAELWDLLLGGGVQAACAGDGAVTAAVLFALLALLDVNLNGGGGGGGARELCAELGRQVVQTQEWVAMVFENTRGDGEGEENEVKMLAAAVLIRLREVIDKYRTLLLGDMIG